MEIDPVEQQQQEDDPFLEFVEYARSVLSPPEEDDGDGEQEGYSSGPGWSWIASNILKTCIAYSSGVTSAILLSDLSQTWNEQHRTGAPKRRPECMNHLKKKHRRTRLPNTVTIDSIYEKNFLSLTNVLEAVIVEAFVLPGTNIYMLTLGDYWSSNTIDIYLHRRYYNLANPPYGILKKGREVFLTGCCLRTAREGSGSPRLLPTEYLVILLDEDLDDDAILIGAQFCSDSFSSISIDAINSGASYSFYARIDNIGSLEVPKKHGSLKRKQITLIDNDGAKVKFLLWNEQVILANLFSVGSMLALDRPYISSSADSNVDTNHHFCIEYGSATQLYLVPFIQHEEQVSVALTPNRFQASRLHSAVDPTQGPKLSQVTLPCDSQGSINFSYYPFRSVIANLRDKMTGISLYGVVGDVFKERNSSEVVFSLKIEDATGSIWAKLHFSQSWSLGRLSIGHTVFISGLTCSKRKHKRFEVIWFEKDTGSSFVNLSCLPALLNSSCLHKFSCLSDLKSQTSHMHICQVKLDPVASCHVKTVLSHMLCGHIVKEMPGGVPECSFCHCSCNTEVIRSFHLKITLADEDGKLFAWCTGQTAMELLQISPDEFYGLADDDQTMYPFSLGNEGFIVALVNCTRQQRDDGSDDTLMQEIDEVPWEITRAIKCD